MGRPRAGFEDECARPKGANFSASSFGEESDEALWIDVATGVAGVASADPEALFCSRKTCRGRAGTKYVGANSKKC